MVARAGPPGVTLPCFAGSWTSRTTGTPWMAIVAKALSQFFLPELLGFMESNNNLLGSYLGAVHCVHCGGRCPKHSLSARRTPKEEAQSP